MRLSSSWSIVLGVALVACKEGDPSSLDTYNSASITGTGTGTEFDSEESTDTNESGTETGEPQDYEGTRYIVLANDGAELLGVNLDHPTSVPDPSTLISNEGTVSLFGPTPHGGHILIHSDKLEQLRLNETGNYDFSPLVPETQVVGWLDRAWFGAEGANAIMAVGQVAGGTNRLLWNLYDDDGEVVGSSDITPPIEANGSVVVPDIATDERHAAVLVDTELDGVWQLYALNLEPQPNTAPYIDQLDLLGAPQTSVSNFIWLDIHPNRISYRKETMPGVFRPIAVALDDPEVTRVNLAPDLGHVSSMMWSPDQSRLLVSAGGDPGYRELFVIEVLDNTVPQDSVKVTEVGHDGRVNTAGVINFATLGHGFDNLGRIWYAFTDSNLAEPVGVGVNLVAVAGEQVVQRVDLIEPYPGLEVDEVYFDANLQKLGFRAQSSSFGGSVRVVDLSQAQYAIVEMAQSFTHDDMFPLDDVNYAWAADGSRIVLVGLQDGLTKMYVGEMSDPMGTMTEIVLPEIESAPGIVIDHKPHVSPDGEHVILRYSAQDGRTGLVYAPLDGSAEGTIVLGLTQTLGAGAYLSRTLE